MRLGIIGFPQSGKTTVFNALTRGDQPTTISGRVEVHTAVVDVPDRRVDRLAEIFQPQKYTYTRVEYADVAGLEGGIAQRGISGPLLNELSTMDGFLHVARCFEDASVLHQAGSVDPARDVVAMNAELILNDLISVERKLERLGEEHGKGGRDRAEVEREQALFQRLQSALSDEMPLRAVELSPEEEKLISSFGFLTLKPLLVVLNLGEDQKAPEVETPYSRAVALQGQLEMEIAQLPPDDAAEFMREYGIEELGLFRMIRESYDLLGLISFFTGDEKEVRAWTLRRGATALEAAGTIHTDMEKGFIRAEVIHFDELDALGSLSEARQQGKLRVEGRDYVVKDGDVIRVRFSQ